MSARHRQAREALERMVIERNRVADLRDAYWRVLGDHEQLALDTRRAIAERWDALDAEVLQRNAAIVAAEAARIGDAPPAGWLRRGRR